MKKQLWILTVLLCVCLSACGGQTPASEAKLQEDLETSEIFARQVGNLGDKVEVTSFNILKRKTDRENRADTIWIQVEGESDAIRSSTYYIMNYGLYNDGWILDDISVDSTDLWKYVPKQKPSEGTIRNAISENAIILDEVLDLEAELYAVKYELSEELLYCDVDYQYALNFRFRNSYGGGTWVADVPYELERFEDWKVDGTWRVKKQDHYLLPADDSVVEFTLAGFDPQKSNTVIGSLHSLFSGKTDAYDAGTYQVHDVSEKYTYKRYKIETGAIASVLRRQYLIYVTYNRLWVEIDGGAQWNAPAERISG